jgi:DNA methylase
MDVNYSQKLVWVSPAKMPTTEWVTVRRVRLVSGFETFYWLAPSAHPKASNRRVLRPYGKTMQYTLARGGDARPPRPGDQGHITPSFARDNGGSIPHNVVITARNAASNDPYCRACRAEGTPIHPARFADAPVELIIKLLTDPNDLVYNPLAGSLKVGEVAERLGRRWISNDKSLSYLYGGRHRFVNVNGTWHGIAPGDAQRF